MSTSGLFGATGEVPGGTSSPMEFTGVPTGDRGESDETALGLLENKTQSVKRPNHECCRKEGPCCEYVKKECKFKFNIKHRECLRDHRARSS